jgi:hypothetical protein
VFVAWGVRAERFRSESRCVLIGRERCGLAARCSLRDGIEQLVEKT